MKTCTIASLLCVLVSYAAHCQNLIISWPLERSNFQQNNSSQADIWVAGQYRPTIGNSVQQINDQNIKVEAKLYTLDNNGNTTGASTSWVLIHNKPTLGLFRGKITASKGWYKLEVRVVKLSTLQLLETSYINKVGVGDVFIIAGQSNAAGYSYNDAPNPAKEYYSWSSPIDKVNVVNREETNTTDLYMPAFERLEKWKKIAPKGQGSWYWGRMAFLIATNNKSYGELPTDQPVTLFNAARAGTTISNWYDSSLGNSTFSIYGGFSLSEIYTHLRNSVNFYGTMFGMRAILWHQGESDNEGPPHSNYTSQITYSDQLKEVIKKTRQHTGKTIPWSIARVSYNGASANSGHTSTNLINAQNYLINANSDPDLQQVVGGMYSDVVDVPRGGDVNSYLIAAGFSPETLHFTGSGLETAGATWAESLRAQSVIVNSGNPQNSNFNGVYTSDVTPIAASPLPGLTVAVSGGYVTVTPDDGYSEWRWVAANGSLFNYALYFQNSTSSAGRAFITSTGSAGTFRCFMKDSYGNLKISQSITLPLPTINSSLRVAATGYEGAEESVGLKIFPNPSVGEITVDMSSINSEISRISIVDESGRMVKEISNPLTKKIEFAGLQTGMYFCKVQLGNESITRKIAVIK